MDRIRVLIVTNMYPTAETPGSGTFVQEQVESLKQEGVQIDVLFVDGMKNRLNYLWGIFRLWSRLLTHRYDLIHAHYVFSGIVARAQLLCPVILTHHGYEVFSGWERYPSRIINAFMDKVILVSQEQHRKLRCAKASIIPCGVDLDMFRPLDRNRARKEIGISAMDKKLVLVLWGGDITRPEKRFDLVQAAVTRARKTDPGIELLAVTGKSHDMIPLYMNACDVLLLVSDAEGSPVVIKEAMACNLPIVSVEVGDVSDVIGNTEGCYICRQDTADIADKLVQVLRQPVRTNGRKHIEHLGRNAIAKQIVAVYREVLRDKKKKADVSDCVDQGVY